MLQTLLNITASTVAVTGVVAENERAYELLSATLDGRVLIAIVDYQGAAVAVDLTTEKPEIITGLAAGVILSDLRDLAEKEEIDSDRSVIRTSSGLPYSEVRIDGEVQVGRVSSEDLKAVIDELTMMPPLQRQQLRRALGL